MKHLYTWGAIVAVAFASVVGDVLLARAMKQVGDVARTVGAVGTVDCGWPHRRESKLLSGSGRHGSRHSSACCSRSRGET